MMIGKPGMRPYCSSTSACVTPGCQARSRHRQATRCASSSSQHGSTHSGSHSPVSTHHSGEPAAEAQVSQAQPRDGFESIYSAVAYKQTGKERRAYKGIFPRGSVCSVVLGGGESDSRRLFPLTARRTLPAVPVLGSYRLIDVALSNLLISEINKVYVLTQYNSTSLNHYLQATYDIAQGGVPMAGDGFLEVVAATQDPKEQRWSEGPADTVRQWFNLFRSSSAQRNVEDILVLPSDQVYRMDFTQLVEFHRDSDADLTIVCRPVDENLVGHFGIVKLGEGAAISAFEEKPQGDRQAAMSMEWTEIEDFMSESHMTQVPFKGVDEKLWIASCGMYIFKKAALARLLDDNKRARDFGRELIPNAIASGMRVNAFNLPSFWVDIGGSIGEFYEFHMQLVRGELPDFTLEDAHKPFFGSANDLPPTMYDRCKIINTLVSAGCELTGCTLVNSVLSRRTLIGEGARIEDSIIMGADVYEFQKTGLREIGPNYPPMGIGAGSHLRKCIVDKNARIGKNVQLVNREGIVESMDRIAQGIAIRDGVIVISKSSVLPDETHV